MEDTLIVKRKTDLGILKNSTDIYHQKSKDYDSEGDAVDKFDYTKQFILGTRENLTPHWDSLKNEWSFYGGLEALLSLANKLQLRDKNNNVILPNQNSFKNLSDPFFNHIELWMGEYMEEGSKILSAKEPIQEFHMRVLKGRDDIENDSREEKISELLTKRGKLHISSPKDELKKKSKKIEEETEAWTAFIKLQAEPDRLKRIAIILDLEPDQEDKDALAVDLKDGFVTNENHSTRYGSTSRKYFLHLCALSNADLEVTSKVMAASRAQIIRRNSNDGYTFQGEKLNEGTVRNDKQLVEFFKDDQNIKLYLKMEKLLEEKERLIN